MSETPPGNASMPPDPDSFLDMDESADEQGAFTVAAHEEVKRTNCSWMLSRSGEIVAWGEGTVVVNFAGMASHGHESRGYVLEVGSKTAATTAQQDAVPLVTPDGEQVGYYVGEVAVKAHPAFSPDVRPKDVHDRANLDPEAVMRDE